MGKIISGLDIKGSSIALGE